MPKVNKPLHCGSTLDPIAVLAHEKPENQVKPEKPEKKPKEIKQKYAFFNPDNVLPQTGDNCFTCSTFLKVGNYEILVMNNKPYGCCLECKSRHIKLSLVSSK